MYPTVNNQYSSTNQPTNQPAIRPTYQYFNDAIDDRSSSANINTTKSGYDIPVTLKPPSTPSEKARIPT